MSQVVKLQFLDQKKGTMGSLNYPLSNMQIELLKLFSRDMEDEDVLKIKDLIVQFLAKKLSSQANEIWDKKSWTNEDMNRLLNEHLRSSNTNDQK